MSYHIQVLSVKLQRSDNTVSWGFNVQGGKEFHSPLVIQKVCIYFVLQIKNSIFTPTH